MSGAGGGGRAAPGRRRAWGGDENRAGRVRSGRLRPWGGAGPARPRERGRGSGAAAGAAVPSPGQDPRVPRGLWDRARRCLRGFGAGCAPRLRVPRPGGAGSVPPRWPWGCSGRSPALREGRAGLGGAATPWEARESCGNVQKKKTPRRNIGVFIWPVLSHFLQRCCPCGPCPCPLTERGLRAVTEPPGFSGLVNLALTFTVRAGKTKGAAGELLGAFSARGKATLCVYAT